MPVFKIVLTNLKRPSISDAKKTIAQVLIEGSFTEEDLRAINSTMAFPTNAANKPPLSEGSYKSQDAMMAFVRTIGPYLSDKILYDITHTLAKIETYNKNSEAYRTSTLAKCFMIYELERHADSLTKEQPLPAAFLSHMQEYVLPLCVQLWPGKIESNVNEFGGFNFNNDLMDQNTKEKYKAAGCVVIANFDIDSLIAQFKSSEKPLPKKVEPSGTFSFYTFITEFNAKSFSAHQLSSDVKETKEFSEHLHDLEQEYAQQDKNFEASKKSDAHTELDKDHLVALKKLQDYSATVMKSGPIAQSAPMGKSKTTEKSKSSIFNFSSWFSSNKPKEAAISAPTRTNPSKRATLSIDPNHQTQSAIYQTSLTDTSPTDKKTGANYKLRSKTQSFYVPVPSTSTEKPVRSIEEIEKDITKYTERLKKLTPQHKTLAETLAANADNKKLIEDLTKVAKQKKHCSSRLTQLQLELQNVQQLQPEQQRRDFK